ncbi:MAG TPA: DUF3662 and FHA domain-containing protein [Candidatus Sulfomarinibacteraceae bacterium]|nr:DUF3662 and FHA domain-containing protein [Candidatus Sulfomarinibacteraceae bacterium]
MRPLSAVERFFERLFERPSTRLLGARVHPVHLLRRLERAMEHGRRADGRRTLVPNRFTVRLHPDDVRRLGPRADLPLELASRALDFARRHGYTLHGRPTVELVTDPAARRGDVEVEASFTDPVHDPGIAAAEGDPGRTRVFAAPVPSGPRATLLLREPHARSRTVKVEGATVVIGRSGTSDLVLADVRASRRHARLTVRDGHLVLTDLGSTNGTRVNGRSVREVAVGEGDEIRIGDSVLIVATVSDDPGQDGPGTNRAARPRPAR